MANTYQYAKKDGSVGTVYAPDEASAYAGAQNIDPSSGLQLMQGQPPAAGATPSPYAAEPTVGQAYAKFNAPVTDPMLGALDQGILSAQKAANGPVDEDAIRARVLSQFQGEIDATNQIYAGLMQDAKVAGQGRIGSQRAISARSGTLGSDFGSAQKDRVVGYNQGIEGSIAAEQAAKIAAIMGKGRSAAADEIKAKREAQEQGLDKYLEYLGSRTERVKSAVGNLADSLISQDVDPSKMDPAALSELARSYGVSTGDILGIYSQKKTAAEEASEKAAREAQFNLSEGQVRYGADGSIIASGPEKDKSFNLGEGESYYAYDPATGGYKLVASKAKTYAPKSGTGSGDGSGGFSGTLSPIAQAVQNGTLDIKDLTPTMRAQVGAELAEAGISSGKQVSLIEGKNAVKALIDNPGKNSISGLVQGKLRLGDVFGDQQAINQYNQIKAILSLDNRQKLKGSGAISDFEAGLLADAATALGRNLEDDEFNTQLDKIYDVFDDKYAYTRNTSGGAINEQGDDSGKIRVQIKATGQTGTIDASEFDPSTMKKL